MRSCDEFSRKLDVLQGEKGVCRLIFCRMWSQSCTGSQIARGKKLHHSVPVEKAANVAVGAPEVISQGDAKLLLQMQKACQRDAGLASQVQSSISLLIIRTEYIRGSEKHALVDLVELETMC